MKKKPKKKNIGISKLIVTVAVILICIGIVYWAKSAHRAYQVEKALQSRIIGDSDADIRIVEYLDFQCPPCAKGYFLLKEYLKKYPSRIQVELKYFPWPRGRHALESAIFAECSAKQEKFWEFTDLLLEKQKLWKKISDEDAQLMFREIANQIGLDEYELVDCIVDEQVKKNILSIRKTGELLGIRRTPTYFINEKMVVGAKNLQRELIAIFGPE